MEKQSYADIILPLSLPGLFTYSIPSEFVNVITRGMIVTVPFGRNSRYRGVVYRLHNNKPQIPLVKEILEPAGSGIIISEEQIKLWIWVSEYYHCTTGDVLNAALPAAILTADSSKSYNIKTETGIKLAKQFTEKQLSEQLDSLKKTAARYRLLMTFLDLTAYGTGRSVASIPKNMLLKESGTSYSVLKKMYELGILEETVTERSRLDGLSPAVIDLKLLSEYQQKTYDTIQDLFRVKDTVLLHGVTSSGKTEIYIHLIEQVIRQGRKVLYLLPEIALTTQIINRLRLYFGEQVGVYHSGLNDNEKAEVYSRISGCSSLGEYNIILGVRSSVFLPAGNLGLVIIDEEHDSSYKQFDPAPRYNARDTALMRARLQGAKVLLGSATPSVESMYNADNGKYGYAYLGERYGNIKMPEIILADSKEAYRKKAMISHFAPGMISAIDEALENNEQVVLLRNRRGFAHFIICSECGWTPVCPNCSVNYVYHKSPDRLYCHYCGSSGPMPARCENCESTNIKLKGFGTEKVEDEISIMFPDAKIQRMDYDSTRRKGSIEKIIQDLEKGKTDILIGTQMISKGLDIENLTVVGILNIDGMLFYPDFRAHERCFQLAAQVSGRAGRRKKRGKVIIQTADPYHKVMKQILTNDYAGLYKSQLAERKEFNYPPYSRLVRIYLKHKKLSVVATAADILASNLRKISGPVVLGPESPPHSRLHDRYIKSILLKTDKNKSYRYTRELVMRNTSVLLDSNAFSGLRIYSDVDPQ